MIPEHYWRIARRWFWLIGGIAIGCAVFAVFAVGSVAGSAEPGYSSAVTLGVTRIVSFGGTVTVGGQGDPQLLANYTENVATRGSTPQFLRRLNDELEKEGLIIPDAALARKIDFVANPGLFRVDIVAEADTPEDAQLMSETTAELLVAEVTAEETRIKQSLTTATEQQQTELLANLNQVYADRIARLSALGEPALREALDNLIRSGIGSDLNATFATLVQDLARITADPQLAVLNSEAQSLERQLGDLSDSQRSFSDDILRGDPVSIVDPVDTVQLAPETSLRTRDLALMGLVVGLVMGWIVATIVDGQVMGRRFERAKEEEWETTTTEGMARYFSHD